MPIHPRSAALLAIAAAVLAAPSVAGAQAPASTLVVHQTTDVDNLYPGGPAQDVAGNFDNTGSGTVHVETVDARITDITGPFIDPPDYPCTADEDFQLNGFPVTVDADVPQGLGVGSWEGGSIQMLNLPRNQNGCQAATITVAFTATVSAAPTPPDTTPTAPTAASPRVPVGLTVSQPSGSTAGGDLIVITGEDFADGASVLFGDVPSPLVTVDGVNRLTAIVPPHAAGDVVLRIVTPAGTSQPFGPYTYAVPAVPTFAGALEAASEMTTPARCVVPRLGGVTAARARARLEAANCTVGTIEHRRRYGRVGRVAKQWTVAGTNLPAGAAVSFTVAKAPRR